MLLFHAMLRLVMTSIFCTLVFFGSIARNYQANVLLSHVSEKHISHNHGDHSHHQDHEHSHKDSKKSNEDGKSHNHQLELNLVTQALHIEVQAHTKLVTLVSFNDVQPLSSERTLLMSNYSFSIFRPPIA
jgi:hypothetical protein